MARIDLLTAQMCRHAAKRLCVQCDAKMQFFGGGGELLGEGAALSGPMIHEFLLQIAPIPFDGVPVSFAYKGCDGEFKIVVAAKCRGFEIHALSFTAPQTQNAFPTQTTIGSPKTTFDCGWSRSGNSHRISPQPSSGFGVYKRRKDSSEEASQDDDS